MKPYANRVFELRNVWDGLQRNISYIGKLLSILLH